MNNSILVSTAINSFFGHKKFDQFLDTLANASPAKRKAYLDETIAFTKDVMNELSEEIKKMDDKFHKKCIEPLLKVKPKTTYPKTKAKTLKAKKQSGGSYSRCVTSELKRLKEESDAYQNTLKSYQDAVKSKDNEREAYYMGLMLGQENMFKKEANALCSREGAIISFVKSSLAQGTIVLLSGGISYAGYLLVGIPKDLLSEAVGTVSGAGGYLADLIATPYRYLSGSTGTSYSNLASHAASSVFSKFVDKVGYGSLKLAVSIVLFILMFIFLQACLVISKKDIKISSLLLSIDFKTAEKTSAISDAAVISQLTDKTFPALITNGQNTTRRANRGSPRRQSPLRKSPQRQIENINNQ
jgi:hypothetical protein